MQRRAVWLTGSLVMALVGSVILAGAASAAPSLVRNGGFEAPALTEDTTFLEFAVGERVGPWKVTSGAVFTSLAVAPFATPPAGVQMMTLQPPFIAGESGQICQRVSGMVLGAKYTVRFLAAAILGNSTIDVALGSRDVAHVVFTDGQVPALFKEYEFKVTAAARTARLCLHGNAAGGSGFPIIDAVRMKRVAR